MNYKEDNEPIMKLINPNVEKQDKIRTNVLEEEPCITEAKLAELIDLMHAFCLGDFYVLPHIKEILMQSKFNEPSLIMINNQSFSRRIVDLIISQSSNQISIGGEEFTMMLQCLYRFTKHACKYSINFAYLLLENESGIENSMEFVKYLMKLVTDLEQPKVGIISMMILSNFLFIDLGTYNFIMDLGFEGLVSNILSSTDYSDVHYTIVAKSLKKMTNYLNDDQCETFFNNLSLVFLTNEDYTAYNGLRALNKLSRRDQENKYIQMAIDHGFIGTVLNFFQSKDVTVIDQAMHFVDAVMHQDRQEYVDVLIESGLIEALINPLSSDISFLQNEAGKLLLDSIAYSENGLDKVIEASIFELLVQIAQESPYEGKKQAISIICDAFSACHDYKFWEYLIIQCSALDAIVDLLENVDFKYQMKIIRAMTHINTQHHELLADVIKNGLCNYLEEVYENASNLGPMEQKELEDCVIGFLSDLEDNFPEIKKDD